jgi:hypothetical protein
MRKEGLAAVMAVLVVAGFGTGYLAVNGTGTAASQSSGVVNETIFIHVVNSTSGEPIPKESLTAGPASSLNDISYTWGPNIGATINECIHEVPNGAVVVNPANGIVVSNGATTTNGPCPLKDYDTNATGWVTISNQHAAYFFIEVGASNSLAGGPNNAQVIAVEGSQTYVTAPLPEGNFTVSSTG